MLDARAQFHALATHYAARPVSRLPETPADFRSGFDRNIPVALVGYRDFEASLSLHQHLRDYLGVDRGSFEIGECDSLAGRPRIGNAFLGYLPHSKLTR